MSSPGTKQPNAKIKGSYERTAEVLHVANLDYLNQFNLASRPSSLYSDLGK